MVWPRTTAIEVHLILEARDDAPCTLACAAERLSKGDAGPSSNGFHGVLILERIIVGTTPGKNWCSEALKINHCPTVRYPYAQARSYVLTRATPEQGQHIRMQPYYSLCARNLWINHFRMHFPTLEGMSNSGPTVEGGHEGWIMTEKPTFR